MTTQSVATLAQLQSAINTGNADGLNDTITLTANITFSTASTININVTDGQTLTIDGAGFYIDAAYLARVVNVLGGKVILRNITIEHGLLSGAGGASGVAVAGGSALGAGISNAGNLTLLNTTVTQNFATGGGGGGGVTGSFVGGGGGGGSGVNGIGGASGGNAGAGGGPYSGVAGGGGAGGRGGGYTVANMGGRGGTTTGGAGGIGVYSYSSGGAGASATAGALGIGGGGGGAGWDANGGTGGAAAAGIFNSGTLLIAGTSVIAGNAAAGGGGGGGGGAGNHGGVGGQGVGGVWNSGGTLNVTATATAAMTGNTAGSGTIGGITNSGSNSGFSSPVAAANINTSNGGATNTSFVIAAPTVTSINRVGASPNSATSDQFAITFSENVTGVDTSDFSLTTTGTASGTIASIAGSGTSYTVTVNGVAGEGTIRLDLNNAGTGITGSLANSIATGYTAGQAYTIDRFAAAPTIALTQDTGVAADRITTNGALTITGLESGATVQYSTDAETFVASFTAVQGLNSVSVRQVDLLGNISVQSAAFTFTLVTPAPPVLTGNTENYSNAIGGVYVDLPTQKGYRADAAVSYLGGPLSVTPLATDSFSGVANVKGGNYDDLLVGDNLVNLIDGSAGADVLFGQGGDDTLIGGAAGVSALNQLWGGSGNDTASYLGTTNDVYASVVDLAGWVKNGVGTLILTDTYNAIENLTGGSGNDTLVGDGLANVLDGAIGNDVLFGLGGNDTLIGGGVSGGGYNQLFGGNGLDTASYAAETTAVTADLENLWAYVGGVAAANLRDVYNSIENLTGGSGADVLAGDASANIIEGGAGADQLYGRGGADTFVYRAFADSNIAGGYDTIADFLAGTDKIDLTAFHTDAAHVQITSANGATKLFVEATPGTFNAATDLAVAFIGTNALTTGDILF